MIAKSYLLKNLETLDKLYNSSTSVIKGLFYSKLAILELCGWIEESMDDVVRTCGNRRIKDKSNKTFLEDTIIKKTYGFEYDKHFRDMLINVIGLVGVEKLEKKIDSKKLAILRATLTSLKTFRDNEAHTHLKGVTKRLNAPSVTKAQFLLVYEGLKEIDDKLRIIGF
jgi:hypothetical protein